MEDFELYVLGCRGSRPVDGAEFEGFGGATSCYIIKADHHAVVLDCGTGFYKAAPYLKDCTQIDILMTHLHYDHILGLLNWGVVPKEAQVQLYLGVPEDAEDVGDSDPAHILKPPYWPVSLNTGAAAGVSYGRTIQLTERLSVRFSPANHPNNAAIIRVGTDEGAVCLICDWEHGGDPVPREMTDGCSVMIYDGMFNEMEYPACRGWGHSTWQEGVRLAQEREIPRLLITHHLPERSDEELEQMEAYAKQVFPNIRFVRAGDVYSLKGELMTHGNER